MSPESHHLARLPIPLPAASGDSICDCRTDIGGIQLTALTRTSVPMSLCVCVWVCVCECGWVGG